jgi:vacuolar-type H+-ATPase subunit E/Vma4
MERLAERIRADAEREVRAIGEEAERRAQAIEAETRERAEKLHRREAEALRERLKAAAGSERSSKEIELRRAELREREALLDELRSGLELWLEALPPAQEQALLAGALARARAAVPAGGLEAPARCRELLGPQPGLEAAEAGFPGGGFRLRSPDGRKVVDMTYRALARDFWERRRAEIAAELFGEALSDSGRGGGAP